MRKFISQGFYDKNWNDSVEAAGRAFNKNEDFSLLFKEIYNRIKSNQKTPFPINSYRALWRLLRLRTDSPQVMSREQAEAFTLESVKMMWGEAKESHYKERFFRAARFFLYVLRFRQVDRGFLDPENPSDSELFQRTIRCLRAAEEYFSKSHELGADRARELVIGIEKFMRFEGSNEILTTLDELAGE